MAKRRKAGLGRSLIRQERLLRDREAIRVLREHFHGFDARDGYSLDVRKIADLPRHLRRSLRAKFAKVSPLLSQPVDLVKPKTPAEAKALRAFTHERFRGMKHFIVQKPSESSQVLVVDDQVQVRTLFPMGVSAAERYYMFAKRPRGPAGMLAMLRRMLKTMPEGDYEMITDTYGPTGEIVPKALVEETLQEYLYKYDNPKYREHRFLDRVLGFRWLESRSRGRAMRTERSEARRKAREWNRKRRERLAREARERAAREAKP